MNNYIDNEQMALDKICVLEKKDFFDYGEKEYMFLSFDKGYIQAIDLSYEHDSCANNILVSWIELSDLMGDIIKKDTEKEINF